MFNGALQKTIVLQSVTREPRDTGRTPGSGLYQARCPRQRKVRQDRNAMSAGDAESASQIALIWYSTGCADGTLTSFAQNATPSLAQVSASPRKASRQSGPEGADLAAGDLAADVILGAIGIHPPHCPHSSRRPAIDPDQCRFARDVSNAMAARVRNPLGDSMAAMRGNVFGHGSAFWAAHYRSLTRFITARLAPCS
jgi:hypothetical protein